MGGSGNASEVVDAVLARLKIPEAEQQVVNKNGQSRVENQIQWARFYMSRAGYMDSSRRGVWTLTEKGREIDPATFDYSEAIRRGRSEVAAMHKERPKREVLEDEITEQVFDTSDYRQELLRTLKAFRLLVLSVSACDYFKEWGLQQVNITGRSGDGGIDGGGDLAVNPIVSFNVLFQCKKYGGAVTPSQVRSTSWSDDGRADKGISFHRHVYTRGKEGIQTRWCAPNRVG